MQKDIIQKEEHVGGAKESSIRDIQVYQIVSDFIKDKEGVRVYRKAEKICKAYFLLTQHIQDNDSIKLKLRSLALDMSSKTLSLVTSLNKTEELSRDIVTTLMALVSVSDIAVGARFISEANYALVVYQVQMFIGEIDTYWKTSSNNNQVLSIQMFDVESLDSSYTNDRSVDMSFSLSDKLEKDISTKKPLNAFPGRVNSINTKISENRYHTPINPTEYNRTSANTSANTLVKENSSSKLNTRVESSKGLNIPSVNREVKNERQSLILSTISARGESSIKDLTDIIKGCSEKTIQRELIALVDAGSLVKTGERRWSRYSIAQ